MTVSLLALRLKSADIAVWVAVRYSRILPTSMDEQKLSCPTLCCLGELSSAAYRGFLLFSYRKPFLVQLASQILQVELCIYSTQTYYGKPCDTARAKVPARVTALRTFPKIPYQRHLKSRITHSQCSSHAALACRLAAPVYASRVYAIARSSLMCACRIKILDPSR